MNIEKLGIKPIATFFKVQALGYGHLSAFDLQDVRKLEQQNKRMLTALIKQCIPEDKKYGIREWDMVELIEEITDKSWEEIKRLLND